MRPRKRGETRVRVHKTWFHLWPSMGCNYAFWIRVAQEAKARGVRANNLPEIRRICEEIDR
jgi:hypothetical protein